MTTTTTEVDGPGHHPLLPRAVVVLLGAGGAVILAGGMRAASGIVAPVMLALVLTIAVAPVRRVALRHRWPSWAATLAMLVTAYVIVLVLTLSLAVSVVKLAATIPQYADQADDLVADLQGWLTDRGLDDATLQKALSQLDIGKVADLLADLLGSLLGVLGSFFFLATVLFFTTADVAGVPLRDALLRETKPGLASALGTFVHATQHYLIMSAIFGGIVAVLDTGALWLLGVPLPALWGLLAFVTNFVPNIGFVIGLVPPAILALLEGGWTSMLAVVAVYCVLNVVIQTFIQPRYVGDAVGLSPTVTFLSLTLWTFVLGSLGALLAVPMTLLARAILIDADPSANWANAFIGSTPPPPEPAAEDAPAPGDPSPPEPADRAPSPAT
jgi:predicted PurR-regulated permease PerM